MARQNFVLHKLDSTSKARLGTLYTAHGAIKTPVFMPVGTQGTVKAVAQDRLESLGVEIFLCNSYHLHLRPGEDLIAEAGGLHEFISWKKSLLTDSGGYQVFSLASLVGVSDEGVTFKSHLDGSLHHITPELSMEIQQKLGADIIMAFDQCVGFPASVQEEKVAAQRTLLWAKKCKEAFSSSWQQLFGIVQGGTQKELRELCAREIVVMGFDGYALGGLSVGEPKPLMYEMIEVVEPYLPEEKPRYLMGVGAPDDILEAVARGIDMFDCVLPTRNARNGCLLTRRGKLNITRSEFARDFQPPDPDCSCYTCSKFSRAYLRHLFKAGEILAAELATIHNLFFMLELMRKIREALEGGYFRDFKQDFLATYNGGF